MKKWFVMKDGKYNGAKEIPDEIKKTGMFI